MIVRESISFERKGDPKKSMNIGMKSQLENFLISIGKSPNLRKENALIHAVLNNKLDIAKYLLDLGTKINIKDSQSNTLLQIAIEKENQEMVNLLVSRKKLSQDHLNSGLFTASVYHLKNFISYLIKVGANPNSKGILGRLAMEPNAEIIKYLINLGADPTDPNSSYIGYTPISHSILEGELENFKIFSLYQDIQEIPKEKIIKRVKEKLNWEKAMGDLNKIKEYQEILKSIKENDR